MAARSPSCARASRPFFGLLYALGAAPGLVVNADIGHDEPLDEERVQWQRRLFVRAEKSAAKRADLAVAKRGGGYERRHRRGIGACDDAHLRSRRRLAGADEIEGVAVERTDVD